MDRFKGFNSWYTEETTGEPEKVGKPEKVDKELIKVLQRIENNQIQMAEKFASYMLGLLVALFIIAVLICKV